MLSGATIRSLIPIGKNSPRFVLSDSNFSRGSDTSAHKSSTNPNFTPIANPPKADGTFTVCLAFDIFLISKDDDHPPKAVLLFRWCDPSSLPSSSSSRFTRPPTPRPTTRDDDDDDDDDEAAGGDASSASSKSGRRSSTCPNTVIRNSISKSSRKKVVGRSLLLLSLLLFFSLLALVVFFFFSKSAQGREIVLWFSYVYHCFNFTISLIFTSLYKVIPVKELGSILSRGSTIGQRGWLFEDVLTRFFFCAEFETER